MHERLSASPANLGMETYVAFARELSLGTASFEACIGSERHVAGIREFLAVQGGKAPAK